MSASAKEYFSRTLGNTGGCCGRIEWKKCLLGHEQPYDFITRRACIIALQSYRDNLSLALSKQNLSMEEILISLKANIFDLVVAN